MVTSASQRGLIVQLTEQFQVTALRRAVPRRHWERFPSRIELIAVSVLDVLLTSGTTATIEIDHWMAQTHPDLAVQFSEAGHLVELINLPQNTGLEGAWLRQVPEAFLGRRLEQWQNAQDANIFRFDAWQLDHDAPRLAIHTGLDGQRMYRNLDLFTPRLRHLLSTASFGPVSLDATTPAVAEPVTPAAKPIVAMTPREGVPVSIIVPCFNEEQTLPYLKRALDDLRAGFGTRHPLRFVLVDDGSHDGTWVAMQQLFGQSDTIQLIQHEANRGIGAAIQTGIDAAQDEVGAVIDSDCSYDPVHLEDMIPLLAHDVAMVTASPYHIDGGVEGVPDWRLVLSKGASQLYGRVLHNKLATYTSCFRVCRKSAMSQITLQYDGYIGVVEQLARLDLAGWRIVEHPVVLESRMLGQSKMKVVNAITDHLKFLAEVSMLRLRGSEPSAANTSPAFKAANSNGSANE